MNAGQPDTYWFGALGNMEQNFNTLNMQNAVKIAWLFSFVNYMNVYPFNLTMKEKKLNNILIILVCKTSPTCIYRRKEKK